MDQSGSVLVGCKIPTTSTTSSVTDRGATDLSNGGTRLQNGSVSSFPPNKVRWVVKLHSWYHEGNRETYG